MGFRFGSLFAAEKGLYRYESEDFQVPKFELAGSGCDVVGEVAASTVSSDEAPGEIGVCGRVVVEKFKGVEAIVVLGWVAVVRREAVVDRDYDGGEFSGKPEAEVVVRLRVGSK